MSWRERLQRASYRGVQFWVESSVTTDGRRVPVRRLAGQDGAVMQDLGREPTELDITAYVFGDDYDWERDDLVNALCESGAGALVHPLRGELWVRITRGPQVYEGQDEGGYCSIRFGATVEDRDAGKLKKLKNTRSALKKASSALRAASTVDFASKFNVLSMPGKYLQSTTNAIANVTNNLRRINGKIAATTNGLAGISAALDDLDNAIDTLIYAPTALMNNLQNVIRSVIGLADHTEDTIDRTTGLPAAIQAGNAFALSETVRAARQASLAGLGADAPATGSTDLAQREADNTRAVYRVARTEALAAQADLYAEAFFDSSTQALDVLTELNDEVDALSGYSAGDELYAALQDLRAALVEHLTTTASELSQVQRTTRHPELPAILLAHELYGDASLEAELVARNQPLYPLFMSGEVEYVDR